MTTDRWFIGEALDRGWTLMRAKLGFLVLLSIVMFLISGVVGWIVDQILAANSAAVVAVVMQILQSVIQIVISMFMIKVSLKIVDEEPVKIMEDLRAVLPRIVSFVVGSILYGLICVVGIILLIVPGVMWSIKYRYYAYFIIDQGAGPLEALRLSAKATNGYKWDLLGFGFVTAVVTLLGLLALVVGLLVALPTVMLAQTYVYRKLAGQSGRSMME